MGGDRKETDEKEKIFEMVDRGGISGFHCRSGNICIYAAVSYTHLRTAGSADSFGRAFKAGVQRV